MVKKNLQAKNFPMLRKVIYDINKHTYCYLILYQYVWFILVKRLRVDHSASSLERNFITPVRAMVDFLLKPTDLESLPKTKRRSPYEDKPPITVYWRKDVETK